MHLRALSKLLSLLLVLVVAAVTAEENNQPNCNIPLTTNHYDSCNIAFCLGQQSKHEDSFVCDISASWMHHVGGEDDDGNTNDWYPATPPKGTGLHEYVAYTGEPPCNQNGHCPGCDQTILEGTGTNNIRLCSIFVDPTDCSVKCPSHSTLAADSSSSHASSNSGSGSATAASTTAQSSSSSNNSSTSWILVAITMVMAIFAISYFIRRKRALQEFVKVENLTELASLNKGS